MTLLDWKRAGCRGAFVAPGLAVTFEEGRYVLRVPGTGDYQGVRLGSMREVSRYLGRGPSEVHGEVTP